MSIVAKISSALSMNYQNLLKAHRSLKELPSQWIDKKTGEVKNSTTKSFSMKISDSLHEAIAETLPKLSGKDVHIKLPELGLVAIATKPKAQGIYSLMDATVILTYPTKAVELEEFNPDELSEDNLFDDDDVNVNG